MATKNDIKDFADAIKTYGEGNVILLKHHWIKLIAPLWQSLGLILLLVVIFYIFHANYYEGHEDFYWTTAIFYIATAVLWVGFVIFGIIKNIWNLLGRKNMYYKDVESLEKGRKWYEIFTICSGVILLLHLLSVIFNIHIPFINGFNNDGKVVAPMIILFLEILFIVNVLGIMFTLMKYELTYYVCSPDSIKLFIQTGFLSVDVSDISPSSINIMKFEKDGLFATLFHYGNINIYTDSLVQTESGNVITLKDMPEPEILIKKIYKIYGKDMPIDIK